MVWKFLVTTALIAAPVLAQAAETTTAAEPSPGEIIVTGKSTGYLAEDTVTATKTGTPLNDVPQSITVVTRERMDDQAMRGIGEVLRYVPGTTVGQGEGNRDQITLRGQNTTADFFLDGVRDDVQYYRSLYNIERVEVLKGPFALIFGRGGSGGIVNRVQKTPSTDAFVTSGSASINSFGSWEVSADVNMPFSDVAAGRINATYENIDSFRDFVDGERYGINPYVAVELGTGWKAGLSYEYVNDERVTDRGVPSLSCAQPCTQGPLTGHNDTFFGVPGFNRTGVEAHIGKLRLDGALSENLSWSSTVLYGDYDKYYTNVFANGAASSPTGTVALSSYTDPTTRENLILQSNLIWDLNLGSVGNKVLLGLEYGDQHTTNERRNGVLSNSTLNLSNIVYPTATIGALTRKTVSDVKVLSGYVQDQISFGEMVDVVVGLRYDRFEIEGQDLFVTPARDFGRTDEKISPRFGVILKPTPAMSLYGSYSQSFLPRSGDQFLSLTTSQQNLAPEKFTNYEIGAKWDIRPDLNLTAAVFRLDRTNATVVDPNNSQALLLQNTRTEGAELAVTGRLLPNWQVSGGYTYQNGRRIEEPSVRLGQVPKHQFALWNRFDFNPSVGVGLGVVHQASQFAAVRTVAATTVLPSFTRVDAALFLKSRGGIDWQLNIENLLDEEYFADAHNNNNITPGAPINARLTARIKY